MGFWSKLFGKKKTDESKLTLADYLNSMPPIYGASDIKAISNDVFRAGCYCICREMKKIHAEHIKMNGSDPVIQNSNIGYVLRNPNPLMTESDFYEKVTWIVLTQENCFIYPIYNKINGQLEALYPLEPTRYRFVEYKDKEGIFVQLWFGNGNEAYQTILPYETLIHWRRNFTRNEYAGGDKMGQFDESGLTPILQLDEQLTKGLVNQVKMSYAINAIVKLKSTYKEDKELAAIESFERKLRSSQSGILAVGNESEVDILNKNIQFVDTELIKYMEEKILRPLGVSIPVLKGEYTTDQYNAFYQSALEPLIMSLSQALTKGLFTRRERGYGNKIQLYPEELIFLSVAQKLELIRLLGDQGGLYVNEARTIVGLKPIAELSGRLMQSLNYIDIDNAGKYQVNEPKKDDTKDDVNVTKEENVTKEVTNEEGS